MTEVAFGPSGLDRRRSERIPMPPTGGPVSVVGGRVVNVSLHGVMIESPVPMERDAVLDLRLVIGGLKVDVGTRVAACMLIPSQKRKVYGIGLEFTRIPEDAQERLRQVLASRVAPAGAA
ncbi:MAG: PilZ domain-containing protein [Acidobacteria bacterium]|nr:PilZ domain-containing protein [Acidobacteriota bacterium]